MDFMITCNIGARKELRVAIKKLGADSFAT
jgi:hypothetical protein